MIKNKKEKYIPDDIVSKVLKGRIRRLAMKGWQETMLYHTRDRTRRWARRIE
jgi:hypothetical protein